MSDDTTTPSTTARPKPHRAATTAGIVRGRTSPTPGSSAENADGRPPTKRARKAINCEPCRNSKLKCDRNRPCSSCVLRGTSAMCYQDARATDQTDSLSRGDDPHYTRIDPAQEIARLRHSISLLEAYVFPHHRNNLPHRRPSDPVALITPKKEVIDPDVNDKSTAAPGILGSQAQGGYYAGPTSAATHLLINDSRDSDDSESRQQSQDRPDEFPPINQEYDRDLLEQLPPLDIIDGLIKHYFEYCNWIYRHINQPSFMHHWDRYKSGVKADRITLATACIMMAIAVHYLPGTHHLLQNLPDSHEEIGIRFYQVSTQSLNRRIDESKQYSLELVELMLARAHFLTLSKTDSEEIWHVRGDLITIGTAMGLHRDPGKWRMHRDVAERRRWAWWHIILLERWQAFMFGRPIAIASHHFDTQLPSFCDPALDKTGRLYLPNIALFRLAFILGDIMDDAVSVRPVPYENVQANDRALKQWMDNLPYELDLDEYRLARSLASPNIAIRRQGVQSVIIRTSYYHIRFTLHRPYASISTAKQQQDQSSTTSKSATTNIDPSKCAQSLEIAVGAADKLITMVGQARPDFLANTSLAVPGHMNWGPFHCFSAAMFFSFQLIATPDQPGAGLFRDKIRKAISTLEQSRGSGLADKAYDILQALAPLYSVDYPTGSSSSASESREKLKAQVLSTVRKLAFPYHDSHDPRRFGDSSPSGRGTMSSPANSTSLSPPMPVVSSLPHHQYESMHSHGLVSPQAALRSAGGVGSGSGPTSSTATTYQGQLQQHSTSNGMQSLSSPQQQQLTTTAAASGQQNMTPTPTTASSNYSSASAFGMGPPPPGAPGSTLQHHHQPPTQQHTHSHLHTHSHSQPQQHQQQPQMHSIYPDPSRYSQYVHPAEDSMWGAAMGFGQGEWSQFLDGVRPDPQVGRHMQA